MAKTTKRSGGIQRTEAAPREIGVSFQKASSDVVQSFTEDEKHRNDLSPSEHAVYATIQVEDNPIRFAFGVDPVPGGLGKTRSAGQTLILETAKEIDDFRFINETATANANLQVNMEYPT